MTWSQLLAWTGELCSFPGSEIEFKWRRSPGWPELFFCFFRRTSPGNWKDLIPGGWPRNGAQSVLTMWPLGAGSHARCRRARRSCAPRRCGPSEGWGSPGPFDLNAPGTWCGRKPSSAPEESRRREGCGGQNWIQMGKAIAICLKLGYSTHCTFTCHWATLNS